MRMKNKLLFCVYMFFCFVVSYSQISNRQIAQKVFDNITNSIGNNFPSPPKLNFVNTEIKVAYITNGNVYLEMKALDILCEQTNKEDAIAYVLSHELAHHYLNHSWMKNIGFTYTSKIKNELSNGTEAVNLRKSEEIQADLFGGFFAQISGYKSLIIGQDVLKSIYKKYNLPENIIGYPSLSDRENIVLNNLEELSKLSAIFKMGNLMVVTEKYSNAIKCFEHILSKNFTSREIYNNLGALYLEEAISFDDELSKFSFPILYEENTRSLNKEILRAFHGVVDEETRDSIMYYLNLADDYFRRSALLDKNFIKPKANLLISELIKTKNSKTKLDIGFNKKLEQLNLNISDENDIKLLSFYLGLVPEIDEDEKLKKSSVVSKYNKNVYEDAVEERYYGDDNIIQLDTLKNLNSKNEYTDLIEDLRFYGLQKVDKTISTGDGIKIKIRNSADSVIYEYNNDIYFVSVLINNLPKNLGLNENSNFNDVITKHGNPSSIYKLNNSIYLNYLNNQFVIILIENQLSEIIYYNYI
jgi:hypothetical protein